MFLSEISKGIHLLKPLYLNDLSCEYEGSLYICTDCDSHIKSKLLFKDEHGRVL